MSEKESENKGLGADLQVESKIPQTAETIGAEGVVLSEDRYRFLVEQSGDMITTHTPGDWAYTAVNPAITLVTGYLPEEVMGKHALDYFHPDDAEAMHQKLMPAIHRHGIRTFRYRHKYKDGDYHWVESTHRSIRDKVTGQLKEVISVTRDISQQVAAEMASKRLAEVVEVSSDLIIFCDGHYRVTYMNGSALQGFGLSKLSGDGQPQEDALCELIGVESFQRVRTLACQVAEARGGWRGHLHLPSPRFGDSYMELQEVLVHGQGGHASGDDYYSLIIRDLTEQRRAEQKLQQHQAEIAHASRLMTMGEMATGLAHEINQPLATTLNYARGAIRQIDSGMLTDLTKLQPVLGNIVRQAQRAADIVKRLRSLVKKTPYQRVRMALNPVCEEVVFFLQHEFADQGVDVALALTGEDPVVEADRVQLEQVLINLLRNALDAYGQVERPNKRVCIATQLTADSVQLTVTDGGIGVSAELLPSLFDPYVSSKKAGLGMGLSISRTIVEAHGGKIMVASDGHSYTTFSVQLPRFSRAPAQR